MAVAQRHQPLADIAARRDVHAQAARGVLMHEAPVGAHQRAPLRFREVGEIAHRAVALAVMHLARIRRHQAGDHVQQRRLAGAGFADDRQRLAFLQFEADVAAGGDGAEALVEAFGDEEGRAHSAAFLDWAACRFSQ